MNRVKLALNICTYKREDYIKNNLKLLLSSRFFDQEDQEYYGCLEIFVVDNASELVLDEKHEKLHLIKNRNTGGSGGFQRGIEEIRKYDNFTHVIFMDDDVTFELSCFYILYNFLKNVDEDNSDRPIAGRMLDKDNPNIQWTAAEKWNDGDIQHVEFLRDITDSSNPYIPGKTILDADAEYGGFWLCCYPYNYVKENDILPFFIHCDDAEYGLRCGKTPIIIEGVHVWHETWEKKMSNANLYYDLRNCFILNKKIKNNRWKDYINTWKKHISTAHINGDYYKEYIYIKAFDDAMKYYFQIVENKKGNDSLIGLKITQKNNIRRVYLFNKLYWRIVFLKAILR